MKLALLVLALATQSDPRYDRSVVPRTKIDTRDLGFAPVDVIPPDECAIRALAVGPNGYVYGATSGTRSHLFVLDPRHGHVKPLGHLPGATHVNHALAVGPQGEVYAGTTRAVDTNGEGYADYEGGHLLLYTPGDEPGKLAIQIEAPCSVKDLGIPVKGQGIYTMILDASTRTLYGLTYPNGDLFSYAIASGTTRVHGQVAKALMPGEKREKEKNIGRALALDADSNVYASGEGGNLLSLHRKTGEVVKLNLVLPGVPGREPWVRVDAWAVGESLYGGTSDGYLFRFLPEENRVENLGKPLKQDRIRGLVFAKNGLLYGVGGTDDEIGRLFSYDPARGAFEILGTMDVDRKPYYAWHAYVIDAMAAGPDGTIYLGQAERKSKLYLFHP